MAHVRDIDPFSIFRRPNGSLLVVGGVNANTLGLISVTGAPPPDPSIHPRIELENIDFSPHVDGLLAGHTTFPVRTPQSGVTASFSLSIKGATHGFPRVLAHAHHRLTRCLDTQITFTPTPAARRVASRLRHYERGHDFGLELKLDAVASNRHGRLRSHLAETSLGYYSSQGG